MKAEHTLNIQRSKDHTLFHIYIAFFRPEGSGFNFATSDATASDLRRQARKMITKMRANQDIDFNQDWKVKSFYIVKNQRRAGVSIAVGWNREMGNNDILSRFFHQFRSILL